MSEIPKLMICVQCKKVGDKEMCVVGALEPLTEAQAAEVIRRAEAYEDLEAERDMLENLVAEKDQEIQELKEQP